VDYFILLALATFSDYIIFKRVYMAIKTKKSKSNKIKPIRATVVEDPSDWKKMWQTALTPPTATQVAKMKRLRYCFGS
jgi:hypothetical protein